jgi:molybdopterin-guanine dinucleotide biosynthesis protein A
MGTDKAFVAVDGVAMAKRVAIALRDGGATEVVCVGGDRAGLTGLALVSIDDEWPGQGPLAGLLTALGWSDEPSIVVAGCDQPWLDAAVIGALIGAHRSSAAPVTVYRVDGVPQPLPGVYDTSLRPGILAALERGERALKAVLGMVEPTCVEALDPGALRDVDRPEDLPSD